MDFQENIQHTPQPIEERRYSIAEYFDLEMKSEKRHEYYDGKIVECAYTSLNHARIVHNLDYLLGGCLRRTNCEVFTESRMVFVKRCNKFYYPDLVIVCGEIELFQYTKNQEATLNPSVLIEVLSDSTENVDKKDKRKCYHKIPSLKQYVLVEQDSKSIEVHEYDTIKKQWISTWYDENSDTVIIGDCEIPIDEIYYKVDLIEGDSKSDN
jgi:Uma2 family endonuclease